MSCYTVLGVPENSSIDVCKSAYKRLCKKYHPDSGGDASKFQEVTSAWNMIQECSSASYFHIVDEITHQSIFTFTRV